MKYFLAISFIFFTTSIIAQPAKKKEEKLPTKAEMDAIMKELDAAMKDIDPETKKMMDSMGIKMPGTNDLQKKMSGVSDTQLKTAWEDENRIVPKKDAARIASIPATPLADAGIPAFIAATHQKVTAKIKPAAKQKGDEVYTTVKGAATAANALANAAAGLWMMGKSQIAIYLMGKVCIDQPNDGNALSNYASMLTMVGLEEAAIPLLNNLNKRYPKNSTILNNIGQAWYGLGDIEKAGKYIDSTLRIAAMHPQANATKSAIEESKGNTQGAKDAAVKAAKAGYSQDKEDRLRKLNISVDDKVTDWPFKPENDPLGLSAFKRPDYPQSVAQSVALKPVWSAFKQQCSDAIDKLETQKRAAEEVMQKAQQQRINLLVKQVNFATQNPGFMPQPPVPFYAKKATPKFKQMNAYWNAQYEKIGKDAATLAAQTTPVRKQYNADMAALHEEDDKQTGEGKPNVDFCPKYKQRSDDFLKSYNPLNQQFDEANLNTIRRQYNELISMMQYTQWPDEFEVSKISMKIDWLRKIQDAHVEFITEYVCKQPGATGKNAPLAEFDDVACKYHSKLNLVIGTIQSDCSRMTTTLNAPFVKLGLKQDMNKDTFGDQFMNCSVEVGASFGAGANAGPLKAEASIGAGVRAEFDRTGMTDLIVKTSGGVGAGIEVDDVGGGVDVGVEAQVSLITGKASVSGSGLLEK